MSELIPPQALRERFVAAATAKFARNVPDFVALQALVRANGGLFRNDHGAIRSADPAITSLFVRAARVLGLRREFDYAFPAKKLISFDLQVIGESSTEFKIFVSQVDLAAFPPAVAGLIKDDCRAQSAAVDHGDFIERIARAESQGGLTATDADPFIEHFVERLMSRSGAPIKRATLDVVAAVSGEAASALALGPDFNHVTIDVGAAGFGGIDAMARAMRAAGFKLLPDIQGAPGTQLRQTATMAASIATEVLEADGRLGSAPTEKQFVEIIERAQAKDPDGTPLWSQNGAPLIFRNFLAANAQNIFDAASTRVSASSC
jgi:uncharacterized glyoxalase superfamily metalloenzyme YdcJ